MMSVLAVIPARGGSRSVPRKNLADFGGKPLMTHMIGHALAVSAITDVVVSTDDDEIADVARRFGAQVPFRRPAELATDTAPSMPVVQHAVREMENRSSRKYDAVVLLQATAPLCRPMDIEAVLKRLAIGDCESVVTVVPCETHPFRLKRIIGRDTLVNFIDQGFEDMRARQTLPPVYRRAGSVYASLRRVVMEGNTLVGADARAVIVPRNTAIDIDDALDLDFARFVYQQRKDKS